MECLVYKDASVVGFVLATLMATGIFLSYVPQHSRIMKRRTSEGLSPFFLLLGTVSAISAFANLLLYSNDGRICCRLGLSDFQCINSQIGMIQVGLQTLGYSLILVLCVYYTRDSLTENQREYAQLLKVYRFFLFYAFLNLFAVVYLIKRKQDTELFIQFANLSGVFSSLVGGLQYLPQIYTTYKLKHPGSLSIKMMSIQTPGGFVWTASLFLQPNSKWSSWLPYFTAAMAQGILLIMCIYYKHTYNIDELEREQLTRITEENLAYTSLETTDDGLLQ
ncbi:BA75_04795T0 [Komagataella pastoris]|uniref:BA75_04795T0 n=1 Tax=Komagataella pastoris TaxID=4922 RepID=A0A1B2JHJ9_PICPA|nr:BA75_04795T0 [Komagataella pastoris]